MGRPDGTPFNGVCKPKAYALGCVEVVSPRLYIAMIKFGINDIRLLYENDVRFLSQFG